MRPALFFARHADAVKPSVSRAHVAPPPRRQHVGAPVDTKVATSVTSPPVSRRRETDNIATHAAAALAALGYLIARLYFVYAVAWAEVKGLVSSTVGLPLTEIAQLVAIGCAAAAFAFSALYHVCARHRDTSYLPLLFDKSFVYACYTSSIYADVVLYSTTHMHPDAASWSAPLATRSAGDARPIGIASLANDILAAGILSIAYFAITSLARDVEATWRKGVREGFYRHHDGLLTQCRVQIFVVILFAYLLITPNVLFVEAATHSLRAQRTTFAITLVTTAAVAVTYVLDDTPSYDWLLQACGNVLSTHGVWHVATAAGVISTLLAREAVLACVRREQRTWLLPRGSGNATHLLSNSTPVIAPSYGGPDDWFRDWCAT